MTVSRRILAFLSAAIVVVAAVWFFGRRDSAATGETYWNADLSTPAAAVETFSEAFSRGDYLMMLRIFDAGSQEKLLLDSQSRGAGQYATRTFLGSDDSYRVDAEHSWALPSTVFVRLMANVVADDKLLIDVADVKVDRVVEGSGAASTLVYASNSSHDDLIFLMKQAPSDRWRVHKVSSTGQPPTATDKILTTDEADSREKVDSDYVHTPNENGRYGRLDLATPETAVETFAERYAAADFVGVALIMDPEAQKSILSALGNLRLDEWLTADAANSYNGFVTAEHANLAPLPTFDGVLRSVPPEARLLNLSAGATATGSDELAAFEGTDRTVLVTATSPDHPDGLGFAMVQAESGRWRVRQVASPPEAVVDSDEIFVIRDEDTA